MRFAFKFYYKIILSSTLGSFPFPSLILQLRTSVKLLKERGHQKFPRDKLSKTHRQGLSL
jgi:hypothetical protein